MKKILKFSFVVAMTFLITGCGKKLSCEDGYILKEKSCYKEIENKIATEVYSCEEGYILSKDNSKCEKIESLDATKEYTCNNGYSLSGDKCFGVSTINATPSYSCPNGGTLNGTNCIQKVADVNALMYGNVCPAGTKKNNFECYYTKNTNETCRAGFTESGGGYLCTQWATKGYYCVRGEQVSNSLCMVTVSTPANVSYSCQNGYSLNGTKCSKNISVNANEVYSCSEDYSLKDNKCQKIIESSRIVNYTCDNRYELKENICVLYDVKDAVKK